MACLPCFSQWGENCAAVFDGSHSLRQVYGMHQTFRDMLADALALGGQLPDFPLRSTCPSGKSFGTGTLKQQRLASGRISSEAWEIC